MGIWHRGDVVPVDIRGQVSNPRGCEVRRVDKSFDNEPWVFFFFFPTGTRTLVFRVRAEYPDQLDYREDVHERKVEASNNILTYFHRHEFSGTKSDGFSARSVHPQFLQRISA